eukprot:scaffold1282_cov251-Pinguiococcus_pyrenoidosus.AAC.79
MHRRDAATDDERRERGDARTCGVKPAAGSELPAGQASGDAAAAAGAAFLSVPGRQHEHAGDDASGAGLDASLPQNGVSVALRRLVLGRRRAVSGRARTHEHQLHRRGVPGCERSHGVRAVASGCGAAVRAEQDGAHPGRAARLQHDDQPGAAVPPRAAVAGGVQGPRHPAADHAGVPGHPVPDVLPGHLRLRRVQPAPCGNRAGRGGYGARSLLRLPRAQRVQQCGLLAPVDELLRLRWPARPAVHHQLALPARQRAPAHCAPVDPGRAQLPVQPQEQPEGVLPLPAPERARRVQQHLRVPADLGALHHAADPHLHAGQHHLGLVRGFRSLRGARLADALCAQLLPGRQHAARRAQGA